MAEDPPDRKPEIIPDERTFWEEELRGEYGETPTPKVRPLDDLTEVDLTKGETPKPKVPPPEK